MHQSSSLMVRWTRSGFPVRTYSSQCSHHSHSRKCCDSDTGYLIAERVPALFHSPVRGPAPSASKTPSLVAAMNARDSMNPNQLSKRPGGKPPRAIARRSTGLSETKLSRIGGSFATTRSGTRGSSPQLQLECRLLEGPPDLRDLPRVGAGCVF